MLAFVVRSARMTIAGAWSGVLEYDDGVHLAAAHLLAEGHLPYRDFLFVQPPGILLLLQPFVGVSHLFGEQAALVAMRLAFVLIGCVNVGLVWRLLRTYGRTAAVAGAGFYAVWFGTATAERTALLEPLLNLALLAALLLLRKDSARHALAAGAILGLACTFKVWPVPLVLALLGWVAIQHGSTRAAQLAAGAAASFAIVAVPFVLAAPAAAFHQTIGAQTGREREIPFIARLRYFDGLHGMSQYQRFVPTVVVLALALAVAAIALLIARRGGEPALWVVLLAVGAAELLAAPSFYYHYAAFVGVPLAAVLGIAISTGAARLSVPRGWLLAGGAVTATVLATAAAGGTRPTAASADELAAALPGARCVWATSSLLLVADRVVEQISCGFEPDLDGVRLVKGLEQTNVLVAQELRRAHAAILVGSPADQQWSSSVRNAFASRFEQVNRDLPDGITAWAAE